MHGLPGVLVFCYNFVANGPLAASVLFRQPRVYFGRRTGSLARHCCRPFAGGRPVPVSARVSSSGTHVQRTAAAPTARFHTHHSLVGVFSAELRLFSARNTVRSQVGASGVTAHLPSDVGHPFLRVLRAPFRLRAALYGVRRPHGTTWVVTPIRVDVNHSFWGVCCTELHLLAAALYPEECLPAAGWVITSLAYHIYHPSLCVRVALLRRLATLHSEGRDLSAS